MLKMNASNQSTCRRRSTADATGRGTRRESRANNGVAARCERLRNGNASGPRVLPTSRRAKSRISRPIDGNAGAFETVAPKQIERQGDEQITRDDRGTDRIPPSGAGATDRSPICAQFAAPAVSAGDISVAMNGPCAIRPPCRYGTAHQPVDRPAEAESAIGIARAFLRILRRAYRGSDGWFAAGVCMFC
jgi:hypothetical protein